MCACSYYVLLLHWYVNTMLFSIYSYFRKGGREAYVHTTRYFGRIPLGTHRVTTFSEFIGVYSYFI